MPNKACALLTAACFLFSAVLAPSIEASLGTNQQKRLAGRLPAPELPAPSFNLDIPAAAGRITDARGINSGPIIVNIQDLHCHAGVQRNIASIIAALDKQCRLETVFVEGGYGNVTTAWLNAVKDPAARRQITEKLVDEGRLTGAEYFSITSGRYNLLEGLEDEKLHKDNIVRFAKIMEKQPGIQAGLRVLSRDLGIMKARYFSTRNKRFNNILARRKSGDIASARFYSLLLNYVEDINRNPRQYHTTVPLTLNRYPNIRTYAELLDMHKRLKYRQAARQARQLLAILKTKLPYSVYARLAESAGRQQRLDAASIELAAAAKSCRIDLASRYPDLHGLFVYAQTERSLNPIALVKEEDRLIEELRLALSTDSDELKVSFLADFFGCFEDYVTGRLSAADYDYFRSRFDKFKALWAQYAVIDHTPALAADFPLLDEYYAVNVLRNKIFLQRLHKARAAGRAGTSPRSIIVLVTGGFHSEGLAALLETEKIACVTVTPNITAGAQRSTSIYRSLMRRQARFYDSQALQATLPSCHAAVLEKESTDSRIVIQIDGPRDRLVFSRRAGQWTLSSVIDAGGNETAPDASRYVSVVNAVNEAVSMVERLQPFQDQAACINGAVKALAYAIGNLGVEQGIWGANGLVWRIATCEDPRVMALLKNDLDNIAALPDLLQNAKFDEARRLVNIEKLTASAKTLVPLLEIPGMYELLVRVQRIHPAAPVQPDSSVSEAPPEHYDQAILPGNLPRVNRMVFRFRHLPAFLSTLLTCLCIAGIELIPSVSSFVRGKSLFIDKHDDTDGANDLLYVTGAGFLLTAAGLLMDIAEGIGLHGTSWITAAVILRYAAILLAGTIGANIIAHLFINWRIISDLVMASRKYDNYGGAMLDGETIVYRAFVTNQLPHTWTTERDDIVLLAKTGRGKSVWAAAENGKVLLYSDESNPASIARAISDQMHGIRPFGRESTGDQLKALILKAVDGTTGRDSARITPGFREMIARADFSTSGMYFNYRKEGIRTTYRYDSDGRMIVTRPNYHQGTDPHLGALRACRNGDAAAMRNSTALYLDNAIEHELAVETLCRLKGRQIIVDGLKTARSLQNRLDEIQKLNRVQLGIRVYALIHDESNIDKCMESGLSGCVLDRKNNKFRFYDFALSPGEAINADLITGKTQDEIRRNMRLAQAPFCFIRISDIARVLNNERDLLEATGLLDLLGDGILGLFGPRVYNERYIRDTVYGFDSDEFDKPEVLAQYLEKMHSDLLEEVNGSWANAYETSLAKHNHSIGIDDREPEYDQDARVRADMEFTRLQACFKRAVEERLLAEKWLQNKHYAASMPAHQKQMLGSVLRLENLLDGDNKDIPAAGAGTIGVENLNEASINKAYRKIVAQPDQHAISEFLLLLDLVNFRLQPGDMQMPQQDMQSLTAILESA